MFEVDLLRNGITVAFSSAVGGCRIGSTVNLL